MEYLKRFIEVTNEAAREAIQISKQIRRDVAALQPGKKILSKGTTEISFDPYFDLSWAFVYDVRETKNCSASIMVSFRSCSDVPVCYIGVELNCPDCSDGTNAYEALSLQYHGLEILKFPNENDKIEFAQFPLADIIPAIVAKKIILTAIQVYKFLEFVECQLQDDEDECAEDD